MDPPPAAPQDKDQVQVKSNNNNSNKEDEKKVADVKKDDITTTAATTSGEGTSGQPSPSIPSTPPVKEEHVRIAQRHLERLYAMSRALLELAVPGGDFDNREEYFKLLNDHKRDMITWYMQLDSDEARKRWIKKITSVELEWVCAVCVGELFPR